MPLAAAETRSQSIDATVVPPVDPATNRSWIDARARGCFSQRIAKIERLYTHESADEAALVRLLSGVNRFIEFVRREVAFDFLLPTSHCSVTVSDTAKVLDFTRADRAREWYREFREVVLMCLVYNIKRLVKP